MKPYLTMGRKNRFPYDELFDVSNQEDDGSLIQVDSKRDHTSRVRYSLRFTPKRKLAVDVDSWILGERSIPCRQLIQSPPWRFLATPRTRTPTARNGRRHSVR